MAEVINASSLSYEQIRQDLLDYVSSKPDSQKWIDYLESGAGITITDLIAGLGSFHAFKQLMRRQESYLDLAQLESSIIELAFNRGFMLAPTDTLKVDITFTTNSTVQIDAEDIVASGVDFLVYSTEAKIIAPATPTVVTCACGNLQDFSQTLTGLDEFQTFSFIFDNKFGANAFESLTFNGTLSVPMLSDLNYLQTYGNDFVLRRMLPNEVRIYVGNGVLGWYNNAITSVQYKILTYNDGMFPTSIELTSLIDGEIDSFDRVQEPVYGMDKDEIRKTATFYPIDGRIVTNADYEHVIMKYFGGVLRDVYSYNLDHTQQVYLLTEDSFSEILHLPQIETMVDQKRGAGILVAYEQKAVVDGLDFILNLTVDEEFFYEGLATSVQEFLDAKLYTFWRTAETLTTQKFAIELSAEFEIEFHPADSQTLDMEEDDFLKIILLTIN